MQSLMQHLRLKTAMEEAAGRMESRGDRFTAGKMKELADKLADGRLEIAFCGHFSAGKSTLVNRLCGHPLLPSSPVPTSANIVTIRYGDAFSAEIRSRQGKRCRIPAEEIAAWCRKGGEIEEVIIDYPWKLLDSRIALMDTPGIDSTDEAHHLATASVMHRADAVFYVMDYNHVQSETNFTFVKALADRGKPVYIVINQIDKHREQELSFRHYQASVEEAFAAWGIVPNGCFFVTMKDEGHPRNEWHDLVRFLRSLPDQADALKPYNALRSALTLAEEHGRWLEKQQDNRKAALLKEIEASGTGRLVEERNERLSELEALKARPERMFEEAKRELDRLAESANLMPAATRELAGLVLESRQPGFRAGWLRSRTRTEAERERRLAAFHADVSEQVQVHLVAHAVRLFKQTAGRMGLDIAAFDSRIREFGENVPRETVIRLIPPGAGATGEAVLNYTRMLAAELKQQYRRRGTELLAELAGACRDKLQPEIRRKEEELEKLNRQLAAYEQLCELEREQAAYLEALNALFADISRNMQTDIPAPVKEARTGSEIEPADEAAAADGIRAAWWADGGMPKPSPEKQAEPKSGNRPGSATAPDLAPDPALDEEGWKRDLESNLVRTSRRLREAARLIADIPALQSAARSLADKAERLGKRQYSLALFGAFSAGKSSFANALLGVPALPVSPNPTTAAVIRILQPKDGWEHGTARVKFKSREALEEDILYSLERLGIRAADLEDGLERIRLVHPGEVSSRGRPHYAFLRAVLEGWERERAFLGRERKADAALYREYAAAESRSCFVDQIELHLSCPMTEAGITLVDTPGADSINARHTGAAFNFIRNADAVLFVTYYNHAFSRADREFLNQLGRVKDSFELDKMFFVVNAADLASSEAELDGVVRHVEEQLLQHGIRHPRIFPVSSVLALEGKTARDENKRTASGIDAFERRFYRFLYEELSGLIVESARKDIQRACSSLQRWMDQAQSDEREKERQRQELLEARSRLNPLLDAVPAEREREAVRRETEELVYYIRQRIRIRFGEYYQLSFNPAALNSGTADMARALLEAWHELVRLISYDLSQEMLATTLRIEKLLKAMLQEYWDRRQQDIRARLADFDAGGLPGLEADPPQVDEQLNPAPPDEKWLLRQFRNPKAFFEGEGSGKLRALLEEQLMEAVAQYGERHAARLVDHYQQVYRIWMQAANTRMKAALDEHVEGGLHALEKGTDLAGLKRRLDELRNLGAGP